MQCVAQRPYATTPLPSTVYSPPLHTPQVPFHLDKSFSTPLQNLTIRKVAGGCYPVIQDVGTSQRLQSQKIQNQYAYENLHPVTNTGHQSNSSSRKGLTRPVSRQLKATFQTQVVLQTIHRPLGVGLRIHLSRSTGTMVTLGYAEIKIV